MGFDLRWIGVERRYAQDLLDRLDLERAGDTGDEFGAEFTLAETPGGWVVLVVNTSGFVLDEALAGVSSRGPAVGCEIVEAATFSRTCVWRDGRLAWSVTYAADEAPDDLTVDGDLPPEVAAIRTQRMADQVGADLSASVRSMFEAPLDIAASLAGYRLGEYQGLEWTVLRRRKAKVAAPSGRRLRSLRAAMLSDLLPVLRTLGWQMGDRPALADAGQICRDLNGTAQMLWFDFASGEETYIIVHFGADAHTGEPRFSVNGHVTAPRVRLPVWKRFTWTRFVNLTRHRPPPDDIVGSVIERALREIVIADEYLRTWAPSPCICIDFARPRVQWPTPYAPGDPALLDQ